MKQRKVPFAYKGKVESELEKHKKLDILREVINSKWASPKVIVKKPDDSIRNYCDFRELNKPLFFDHYPLPNIQELFAKIESESTLFAKLDMIMPIYK